MTSSWTEVQSEDSGPNLMSALAQKQTCAAQNGMSALPPKRTCAVQLGMSALGQKRTLAGLFDHLDDMGSIELTCRDIIEILQVARKFLDPLFM